MRLFRCSLVLASASLLLLAACGSDSTDDPPGCTKADIAAVTELHKFVVNGVKIPANIQQAGQLALNIDSDADNTKDNQLGEVIGAIAGLVGSSIDFNETAGEALNEGSIILLAEVKATSLTEGCGSVNVYLGKDPTPAPCENAQDTTCGRHLDGNGTFVIDDSVSADTEVVGTVNNSRFLLTKNDEPGSVSIQLDLGDGQPITLNLSGARIEIPTLATTGITDGLLGGAITKEHLDETIIPAIHGFVEEAVKDDCTAPPNCTCTLSSPGALILDTFDLKPKDCVVTQEELTTHELIETVLKSDVDLFDAKGVFNPNDDGVVDSLSLGIGFSATTASF
ncbi:MAG: hypothetical protein MJE77_02110 [Proteobacteria bacterium]|nr:hypothetical protein [Pseudomonadota bacterium]